MYEGKKRPRTHFVFVPGQLFVHRVGIVDRLPEEGKKSECTQPTRSMLKGGGEWYPSPRLKLS